MILTTKGRYAVMAMVDLALQKPGEPVSLSDIAARQDVARNYLEQLFAKLRKRLLVISVRGTSGGYLLAKASHEISIAEIVHAVDESLKMTRCGHESASGCRADQRRCYTHNLWEGLQNHVHSYFAGISLADVCQNNLDPTAYKVREQQWQNVYT